MFWIKISPEVLGVWTLGFQLVALFGETFRWHFLAGGRKFLGEGFESIISLAPLPVHAFPLLWELSASCACCRAVSTIGILTLWNRKPKETTSCIKKRQKINTHTKQKPWLYISSNKYPYFQNQCHMAVLFSIPRVVLWAEDRILCRNTLVRF